MLFCSGKHNSLLRKIILITYFYIIIIRTLYLFLYQTPARNVDGGLSCIHLMSALLSIKNGNGKFIPLLFNTFNDFNT